MTRALAYIAAPMRWQLHVNGTIVDTQDDYQTAGENYYDVEDVTGLAAAAQRAHGRARGPARRRRAATRTGRSARPTPRARSRMRPRCQPMPPAGTTSITVATATASTCTSAPDRSAAFCGAGYDWYAGETLGFGTPGSPAFTTDTIAAIAGPHGHPGPAAARRPARRHAVTSENGPPGCSSRSWSTTPDGRSGHVRVRRQLDGHQGHRRAEHDRDACAARRAPETTSSPTASANARTLAGWDQRRLRYPRAWQPAVVMGTAPLPNPPDCGDYSATRRLEQRPRAPGHRDRHTGAVEPVRVHPPDPAAGPGDLQARPPGARSARCPTARPRPTSATRSSACPWSRFPGSSAAQAGQQVTMTTSYRLAGTVTTAAGGRRRDQPHASPTRPATPDFAATGAASRVRRRATRSRSTRPADGYGAGHPRPTPSPASAAPPSAWPPRCTPATPPGVWVQGSRVGTATLDTQTTNLNFYYTTAARQGETTDFYVPMGWRYLQIYQGTAADGGRPLTASDIWAVEQYNAASQVGPAANDPGERARARTPPPACAGYADTASGLEPGVGVHRRRRLPDRPGGHVHQQQPRAERGVHAHGAVGPVRRPAGLRGQPGPAGGAVHRRRHERVAGADGGPRRARADPRVHRQPDLLPAALVDRGLAGPGVHMGRGQRHLPGQQREQRQQA